MGHALRAVILATLLIISGCFVFAQDNGCVKPTTEISNLARPTGVLRADPKANETASQKIARDAAAACSNLSDPAAFRHVRMSISDNNIVLSGWVPTASDGLMLIVIVTANADGRTVFNRLDVVPLQKT